MATQGTHRSDCVLLTRVVTTEVGLQDRHALLHEALEEVTLECGNGQPLSVLLQVGFVLGLVLCAEYT